MHKVKAESAPAVFLQKKKKKTAHKYLTNFSKMSVRNLVARFRDYCISKFIRKRQINKI